MRIKNWNVDGFGALRNLESPTLDANLVVIHGPNEAGKSTLLEFMRWMLFGQPNRIVSDRDRSRRPVTGGEWGGRLSFSSKGEDLSLLRRFGLKSDQLCALRSNHAEWQGEDAEFEMARLLGGADVDLFNRVYALDLAELNNIGFLDDTKVSTHLAMAGVTGAAQSANQSLAQLAKDKSALLLSKGTSARLNDLAKQLADADVALRAAQNQARTYTEVLSREQQTEASLSGLRDQQSKARTQQRRAELLASVWPTWVEMRQLQDQIQQLPNRRQLTEDFVADVDYLGIKAEKLAGELDAAQTLIQGIQTRISDIEIDELAHVVAADIRELATRQHMVEAHRTRISELQRDAERRSNELASLLQSLGSEITKDQLRARPLTLADDAVLDDLADRTAELTLEFKTNQNDRNESIRRRIELDGRVVAIEREMSAIDSADPDAIAFDLARLDIVRERIENEATQSVAAILSTSSTSSVASATRKIWFGISALMLVAGIAQAAIGAWIGAAICGVIAIVGATASFFAKSTSAVETRPAAQAATSVEWNFIDLPPHPTLAECALAREKLLAMRGVAEIKRDLEIQFDQIVRERAALEQSVATLDRRISNNKESGQVIEQSWRDFVSQWGDRLMPPVSVARRFSSAMKEAHQLILQEDSDAAEMYRLNKEISKFDNDVEAATVALGETSTSFSRLMERVAAAEDAHSRQDQEQRALTDAHTRLAEVRSESEDCQDQIVGRCADVGASSLDQLQSWIREQRRRNDLEDQIPRLRKRIDLALGGGEQAEAARRVLEAGDKLNWEIEGEQAKNRLEQLEDEIDAATREAHDVTQARKHLESSADVAERSAARNAIATQLKAAFEDYVTVRASELTIKSTLRQYESERQPAVFTQAARWFGDVTEGRYQSVIVRNGKPMVRTAEGGELDPSVLSTGTLEQLYLCIRLALAADLGSRSEQMPFVLDDILVNFDQTRAGQVAKLIRTVAFSGQQVLMFTCHERTRDLIKEVEPNAQVVELERIAHI